MQELQQKDKKVVLSAKALEMIYHTASSSIGKLISGKQYLGRAALEQMCDKIEAEGKELLFRKKKKLPQRLAKTSGSTSKNRKKFEKIITDDEFREYLQNSRKMQYDRDEKRKLKSEDSEHEEHFRNLRMT